VPLKITIEVVPQGIEEDTYQLHTVKVVNRGKVVMDDPKDHQFFYQIYLDDKPCQHLVIHHRNASVMMLLAKVFPNLV
jgi:hypothetical protein